MNKIALSAAALAIMAVGAHADVTIDFPAGNFTDSSLVNAAIPMQTFSDDLTTTELTMTNKVARVSVTWGAVPEWGANAGILLPFNNLWTPIDMSEVTAVSFKYKTSDAKTTVQFAPNSDLYPGILDGVMMVAALGASAAGTTKPVALPSGITYLKWMKDQHAENTSLTWNDVKGEVKLLQFQPMPVYNSTGDAVTTPTCWLEISEVKLIGNITSLGGGNVNWLSNLGTGCTGSKVVQLDKFSEGSNQNVQGGYWYTFTDKSSAGKAGGESSILIDGSTDDAGIQFVVDDGTMGVSLAGITATLDKGDATARPYGGWADFGTGFQNESGDDMFMDLPGLKAISFYIQFGTGFDVTNLTGVDFKVQHDPALVGDSVQFNAGITPELANGKEVCIDVAQFAQPAWYTAKAGKTAMPTTKVGKFSWEIKINKDATVAAAPSQFLIGDVKLWGTELAGVSSQKVGGKSALVANYSKGLVLSYDLAGASAAKIDVVRMDGSKVASFEGAAKASNQSFSVNLARGTYLAVVKGGKTNLVAPFAVAK